MDFLERKAPLLIKVSATLHSLLFVVYTVVFLYLKQEFDLYFRIYVSSILILSCFFLNYFAHHSVKII